MGRGTSGDGKPWLAVDFAEEDYPLTFQFYVDEEVVWERKMEKPAPGARNIMRIPSYKELGGRKITRVLITAASGRTWDNHE